VKLLTEIIEAATDPKQSVAATLRKSLILAFDLKNDRLKAWVEGELNGFSKKDDVPDYRKVRLHSRGNFHGPYGAWIPKRPLPLGVLEERDREYLVPTILHEPIASYESMDPKTSGCATISWPPDLIVRYQAKFIEGYALAQAWQDMPTGMIVGVVDTVRSRLLRFALEIGDELGLVSDDPSKLSPASVDRAVINYIFGGTNVIAGTAHDFTQIGAIRISEGDLIGIANSLRSLGIKQAHVEEATQALVEDGKPDSNALGKKSGQWIKTLGSKLGDAGLKIGTGAAQQLVTQWMLQYWGFKP
jgi:hypothetical protein